MPIARMHISSTLDTFRQYFILLLCCKPDHKVELRGILYDFSEHNISYLLSLLTLLSCKEVEVQLHYQNINKALLLITTYNIVFQQFIIQFLSKSVNSETSIWEARVSLQHSQILPDTGRHGFKPCRSLNFFQASFSAISLIAVYLRGSIRY